MSIYSSAVKRPITTIMLFFAIIVLGVFSLVQLPVDLYPEIEPPYISVMTTYPGANAADIEENVTRILEESLNAVDDLKELSSVSYDNMSIISLEFDWDADLSEASNNIRDVIDRSLEKLPDDINRPAIYKFNASAYPVLMYAITANESYPGLKKIIDDQVVNRLNRIEGVGSVSLSGSPERVVYVDIDPVKLEAHNLSIDQIGNILAAENVDMPAGSVKMGKMDYQFRVEGQFQESDQIKNIVIGYKDKQSVRIRDIASVRDTIKDITQEERVNQSDGAMLFVMKQSGANTVKIAREVEAEMEIIRAQLPPDIQIHVLNDSSDFIVHAIGNLSETLMYAMIFVILVVLFFLGRWRATFIVVITIPISLIVSFIYLYITDQSLNIISLTSLSIAIGMVVDDAIVVLENISRHVDRGSGPRESSIYATNEVWLSVIVTTMVVVAVFFPLTLVSGITGVLFRQLGWIVTITTVTSTITAISLTPMLSSKLLKLKTKSEKPSRFSYDKTIKKWLDKLDNLYERLIRKILNYKLVTIIATVLVFWISIQLPFETDFMPQNDRSELSATIELQTGLRVEETAVVAHRLENIFRDEFPEIRQVNCSYGSDEEGGISSLFNTTGSNVINFRTRLVKPHERERDVFVMADRMREILDEQAEVISYNVKTSGHSFGGENNVEVEIYGYDFNTTNLLAQTIADSLKLCPGARDVKISREDDKPELQLFLDQDKLSMYGLNTATVSAAVRGSVYGSRVTKFKENGEEYDIIVRLEEDSRNSISKLENLTMVSPSGNKIKLKEIGRIEEKWSPPNIERKRKERIVNVSAVPGSGVSLGKLSQQVNAAIENIEVPSDVILHVGGAIEDQKDSFMDLILLMALSLILVYIVMASQFESYRMPLIIMLSIPFAFSGVFIALWLTGTTMSVIAVLGAVMLIGIVVKNGIVLVDYINLMLDRGMELYEAIAVSGKSRLRPVLMTAFTTVLGILPMALSTGEGSETWRPMGVAVIGGLIFSTIITLIIIPVAYAGSSRRGARNKKKKVESNFRFMDGVAESEPVPYGATRTRKPKSEERVLTEKEPVMIN